MDRLVAVNNETLYIDRSCLRCFFHRIKWNCLDAFNASATLRGTPLWYPLSQFPATRLCLIPPPFFYRLFLAPRSLFFPLPLSRFSSLFISRFSFPLLSPLRSFCPVREHLEKRKKRLDTRRHRGGVRGFDSTRGIQSPSPILPPVARTAPAEKRFRFIKSGGRATPSKNDRLWDGQRLCFPFQILF